MNIPIIRHVQRAFAIAALLVAGLGFAAEQEEGSSALVVLYSDYSNARYAVQWQITADAIPELRAKLPRHGYLMLYSSQALLQATKSPTVKFGFFKSRTEAEKFAAENSVAFANVKVVNVEPEEHQALLRLLKGEPGPDNPYVWLNSGEAKATASTEALLEQAKAHYINDRYTQALAYYQVLSLAADPAIAAWARELMAVCFERLGQPQLALETYRHLLFDYPEASFSGRLEQRARALQSIADDGKEALRKSTYGADQDLTFWRGVFGQSYQYLYRGGKHIPDQDVLSVISTNFDVHAGADRGQHEVSMRLNGYALHDLLEEGDDSAVRIKRFYLDYTHSDTGANIIGGRQRNFRTGVYTSFDGASISYPVNARWTMGASVGIPVQFSDFYDTLDRQFYSVQTRYDLSATWQFSGYFTQQSLVSEVDRSAFGGEIKYITPTFSSYVNVDYDVEFAELNIFRWGGTYRLNKDSNVTATYGRQRSPFLTATNILLGQPYLNVEEHLRSEFNREYLLFHALERTSVFEYGSLFYNQRLDENLQYTVDVYQSVMSEVPIYASETGLLTSEVVSTAAEFRYSAVGVQMIVSDFFGVNDTATLGFRHSDTTLSSSNSLRLSERFRFWDKFYFSPRLNLNHSTNKTRDNSRTTVRGSLIFNYKPWRRTDIRLEVGNETTNELEQKNSVYSPYLFIGYQTRF